MSPERREILERVARGELSPEEADRLLRELDEVPSPDAGVRHAPPARSEGVSAIKVSADFGAIIIEGDSSVTDCEITGKHTASMEGSTMVIRGDAWSESAPTGPGVFAVTLGGGRKRVHSRTIRISDFKGFGREHALRVRMNPSIALDVKMDAGSLAISNVVAPVRVRAAAGPVTIEGFEGPLDVSVNAGAVRAIGRLSHGDSRVSSDAGAVRIELANDSDVEVTAEAALGKVIVPGHDGQEMKMKTRFGSNCRTVIGSGTGKLRVETAMGSIHVSVR